VLAMVTELGLLSAMVIAIEFGMKFSLVTSLVVLLDECY
jgi:hypothetical protein